MKLVAARRDVRLQVLAVLALATGCLVVPSKSTTQVLVESRPAADKPGRPGAATLQIDVTPEALVIVTAHARTCILQARHTYEITDHWDARFSMKALDHTIDPRDLIGAAMISWITVPVSGLFTGLFDAAEEGHKHDEEVLEATGQRACPLAATNLPVSVVTPQAATAIRGKTNVRGEFALPLPQSSGVVEVFTPESSSFINYVAPDEADEIVAVRKLVRSCGAQRQARGTVRIAVKDEAILVDTRDARLATCIGNGITGLRRATDHAGELAFSYRF
jgi:hypothetical protein